jgi:ferredoxin, 2Fe-2S
MPAVTFIEHNGKQHLVTAVIGLTLMRAAIDNNVPGIDADCGGNCACATCHVYVDPAWQDRTGVRTTLEEEMLSFAAVTQGNSRLACQIPITEALDGLVVTMPDGQH